MKFSLSLFERNQPIRTGGEIKSPRVLPQHAEILREVAAFNAKSKRMYDAAVTTNLNLDFPITVGSANAEILTSKYITRGRARTLVRDFTTAKGALRVMANNVCGEDPFKLEMKVGKWTGGNSKSGKTFELETETNRLIEEAWKEAGLPKNCDSRGEMSRMEMYRCAFMSVKRDGDILARHRRAYPFNKYGYALELIEADRLQESYVGKSAAGNPIRFSIERDSVYLRPIAYYILTRHPGEPFGYYGPQSNAWRERVPADEMIHYNNLRDRAEQDVGMTEFDSSVQALHRLRQYGIAHTTAAIMSAAKPWWIKQTTPTSMPYVGDPAMMSAIIGTGDGNLVGTGENQGTTQQIGGASAPGDGKGGGVNKFKNIEPGTAEIMNWGQELMQLDPKHPYEAAVGFNKNSLENVGTGLGLAYHAISGDYTGLSFSAARVAEMPQRDNFKVDQEHMILNFVRDHFCEWLKYALLSGAIDLPFSRYDEFCKASEFNGRRWDYINPMQDVQADVIAIEAKIKSRSQVIREREGGGNFERVISELAEENAIAEAHDIDLNPDAVNPGLQKGEPGTTQPAGAPAKNGKSYLYSEKTWRRTMDILQLNGDTH